MRNDLKEIKMDYRAVTVFRNFNTHTELSMLLKQ